MRLVVVTALGRDVRQAQSPLRNETACPLEPEYSGGRFGRNTDCVSKTLTEIPPAITDFPRQLPNRHRPMAFRQPFPCPADFRLGAKQVELRSERPVQDGEALVPGMGANKPLDETFSSVVPDIGEAENERGYFLTCHPQDRLNAERFDEYVQPESVTMLPHDRRSMLKTTHECG